MRKIRVSTALGYILLLLIIIPNKFAVAQTKSSKIFDLKDGDRVVFLGSSVFENDFQYGYLELALTTRFHNRNVTFRNLGWTGDNVWGDARSTFTNPPTPYQHLMRNITDAQPTVVFVAYGGVEAQDGEAGLPKFKEGLNKLLDKINELGAKAILLSPIPVLSGDSAANLEKRNADLQLYASEIARTASERGDRYVDIYNPILEISKKATITENGVHLNETGYYYLATALEKGLGLTSETLSSDITVSKNAADAKGSAKILETGNSVLKFTIDENHLPFPIPSSATDQAQTVKISGLKKGIYTLISDDEQVATASAKKWAEGVAIKQGPSFTQIKELREMIIKKNGLHFYQYRPMNETYIIGFRAYEQGKHVKDLEDQSILIKWIESQIALTRSPKAHVYQLVPVSN